MEFGRCCAPERNGQLSLGCIEIGQPWQPPYEIESDEHPCSCLIDTEHGVFSATGCEDCNAHCMHTVPMSTALHSQRAAVAMWRQHCIASAKIYIVYNSRHSRQASAMLGPDQQLHSLVLQEKAGSGKVRTQ